jgi:hypothetical protein
LVVLANCQRLPENDGCNGVIGCLSSSNGIVLGGDSAARLAATRELQSAAAARSAWFGGRAPRPGLVILDAGSARNAKFVTAKDWTLNYARLADNRAEGDGPSRRGDDGGAADVPFAVDAAGAEFDVTRPGVLAHEICHRHAHRAFEQAWGPNSVLPDMLDEVVAVSCESKDMKEERIRQFARSVTQGNSIPWRDFLNTRHPLKNQDAMKAMSRLAKPGSGAVTFDIRPGSAYGLKLAVFYSQAAAFGAFLDARSCKGKRVFGQLLSTYDSRQDLDYWLHVNGARFCLPLSVAAFEDAFSRFIAQAGSDRARGSSGPDAAYGVKIRSASLGAPQDTIRPGFFLATPLHSRRAG